MHGPLVSLSSTETDSVSKRWLGVYVGDGLAEYRALGVGERDWLPRERAEPPCVHEKGCCGNGTWFLSEIPECVVSRAQVVVGET